MQAFKLCKSGDFDLSHESITSAEALRALREIQQTNPEKWSKICLRNKPSTGTDENHDCEDESPFEGENTPEDDSAITVPALVAAIPALANQSPLEGDLTKAAEGHLELTEDTLPDVAKMTTDEILAEIEAHPDSHGRGKRHRVKSRRYAQDYEELE